MAGDLLVLVPGILGSALAKDGRDLWRLSFAALWRLLRGGRDLSELRLHEASIADETADGVVATGLLDDVQLIPGLIRIDGYTRIAEELARELELPPEHIARFAYDWRRDNRGTARRLGRFVEQRLAALPADAKCILVCHSMGGLVARYWLEVLGGWRRCRALVTIATPHRGSLDALGFLVNGRSARLGPVVLYDVTETLRSCTSVYQLMPIYPCIDLGGGRLLRVTEAGRLPNLDAARARDAIRFHHEIRDAAAANLADPAYRAGAPIVCPVVGTHQPTRQSARLAGQALELLDSYEGVDLDGDGTVPRVSATPIELGDEHREVFVAGRHSSLQNLAQVIEQIRGVATGADLDLFRFRGIAPPRAKLALEVDDAFAAGEPVSVRARPSREPVTLDAVVRDAAGGGIVARERLERDGGGAHVASFDPLPEGTYRLEVGGDGAAPVHEVFAVLGDEAPRRRLARAPVAGAARILYRDALGKEGSIDLGGAPVWVGRAPDCAIRSDDTTVSREHAVIRFDRGRHWIEDVGSTHGTQVNDVKVQRQALSHNDVIRCGSLWLRFVDSGARFAGAAAPGMGSAAPPPLSVGGAPSESKRLVTEQGAIVRRHPTLEVGPLRPAEPVTVRADLTAAAANAAGPAIAVVATARTFPVEVVLSCAAIDFADGGRGEIRVDRDGPSVAATIAGTVAPTARPGQDVELRASYFVGGRQCGAASTWARVGDGRAAAVVTGAAAVALDPDAAPPDLTVEIIATAPGRFMWNLHPSRQRLDAARARLPANLRGVSDLGGDPASFVAGAFQTCEQTPRGQHLRWMEGFGEQLYEQTPACFKECLEALAAAPDEPLAIQFISDDPHLPWELMALPEGRGSVQLATRHAAARWLGSHTGWLRNRLNKGRIAAIAPRYPGAAALPNAAREIAMLEQAFGAARLSPASRDALFALLESDAAALPGVRPGEVAVLHYAGHGEFSAAHPQRSALLLEDDGRVEVPEVRRRAVVLGADTGAVVFLNACQVGRSGAVLGTIGGWAEAFIARQFAAVIAPLWSVYDDDALAVVAAFYRLVLEDRLTLAEALRRIRAQHGPTSQTYQSYLLFGDVMARFA